jgi:hypothetical protein
MRVTYYLTEGQDGPYLANIDFSIEEHTVQQYSVADQHTDLLKPRYPGGSIEEVRLHHVFEQFAKQLNKTWAF